MSAFRVILFSRHALRCSRSLSRHYAGLSAANTRFCRERAQPTPLFVQQQVLDNQYGSGRQNRSSSTETFSVLDFLYWAASVLGTLLSGLETDRNANPYWNPSAERSSALEPEYRNKFSSGLPSRLYSKDNETPWTDVKYDELKALIKSGHVQLVDVREPEEIASTGLLPGAINIPLGRLHQALNYMSDQAFQNKYQRPQPKKWDNNILLYGQDFDSVRATAALELLHKWGFIKCIWVPDFVNRLHIDLKMPAEEFKEKYGVAKPGKDNLLLHCLGGIRSRGALAIAHSLGFEKARHYIGGYAEWVAKQQG
ncbi:TSTD1 [Branchiostoma lanceolatum]|uniref:TSTD1 protein n=1 Tax=Branchiostoma lanceolatum TaxID=7740 RepID=A0A8J9ZA95_BRALA|nr:TSTD1 [Branchiostoma lanceolatum]